MGDFSWPETFEEREAFLQLASGTEEERELLFSVLQVYTCQQKFTAGNKYAVLEAVAYCVSSSIPLPEWAKAEFLKNFKKVDELEAGSWDEAFGSPAPVDRQRDWWKNRLKMRQIYEEVESIHASGGSYDDATWEAVKSNLSLTMSSSLVRNIYYEAKDLLSKFNNSIWKYNSPKRE